MSKVDRKKRLLENTWYESFRSWGPLFLQICSPSNRPLGPLGLGLALIEWILQTSQDMFLVWHSLDHLQVQATRPPKGHVQALG